MDMKIDIRPGRTLNIAIYKNPHSNDTAFLFHGLGGRSDQWREQIALLKSKYTVVAPDLYGLGKSNKPKVGASNPYSFDELNQDVHLVFDKYAGKNNIVLGHSYGGALATFLAMDRQDRINKLVLIDPVPCIVKNELPTVFKLPTIFLRLFRPWLERHFEKLAFDVSADSQLIAEENRASKVNRMYVISAMVKGMLAMPTLNVSTLKVPTLIIAGAADGIILPEAIKQFYTAIPNHQFLMVDDASHMAMLEKPELVNKAIMGFAGVTTHAVAY